MNRERFLIMCGCIGVALIACYSAYVLAWLLAQGAWTPPSYKGLWW